MPKSSRGGRRSAPTTRLPVRPAQATPQQAQNIIQQLQNGDTIELSDFLTLSEDDKADAISTIMTQGIPNFLDDSPFQKILYYTEVDGKPHKAADSVLDNMAGPDLFRTVNSYYDRNTDVNYTAKEIYNQVCDGDYTMVSGRGGSAYGKGIYFADSFSSSKAYGNSTSKSKTLVMRAKFNNNAKSVSYSTVTRGVRNEISSGSKLGKVLRRMDSSNAESTYALCKGYNVIRTGGYGGYYVVLDRSALTMSTTTKAAVGSNW